MKEYLIEQEGLILEAAASKMGRPKTPAYKKKTMRYARIEKVFGEIYDQFESKKDRDLVLQVLEKLKQ